MYVREVRKVPLWFIETVDRCSDFWNRVAVKRASRGLGIGKALLEETLRVARDNGFLLLRSYYSASIVGFECMNSLNTEVKMDIKCLFRPVLVRNSKYSPRDLRVC
ncbi:hypothetical protein L798_12786 [Zootermopsis nevadensis]|uniref:N-acetyltransferase domain-containing protein n=1 Tax=Zootermopsis nevadensis TaxID=136037 RepID=A0A067RI36_ZOONE|nr:hypothetical protein L798_12786 [Zootermopsis nevadensis]